MAAHHGLELSEELGRIVPSAKQPEVEKDATEEQVRLVSFISFLLIVRMRCPRA